MRASVLAVTLLALASCNSSGDRPHGAGPVTTTGAKTSASPAPSSPVPSGPALAERAFYRLDATGPLACKVGETCAARVVLTALAGHKVNDEYPTKFVPTSSPDVAVKGPGTFALEATQRGVLTLEVTPQKAGALVLEGTFKLSVCTDERCEIESPTISLPIVAT